MKAFTEPNKYPFCKQCESDPSDSAWGRFLNFGTWNKLYGGYLFVGRVYPNGKFGIGRLRATSTDESFPRNGGSYDENAIESCRVLGVQQYLQLRASVADSSPLLSELRGETAKPLALANCANSHTRKARGTNGLSKHGRRLLLNVLDEKQRRFGRNRLSFGTFTVPPLQREDFEILCQQWAEIVRVFLQKLSRMLGRANLPTGITGCVEIQEERLRKYGLPYPHLHLVWIGKLRGADWSYTPEEYRYAWLATLAHYIPAIKVEGSQSGEKVVGVKKSVSAYLAKYLSKGYKAIIAAGLSADVSFIKSWYICSLKWRQWFAKATLRVSGPVAELLVRAVEDGWNGLSFSGMCQLPPLEGFDRPITIGWYGTLKGWAMKEVKEYVFHAN